ncbi:hypothetical protein DSO57_1013383 [Entomophthora muscae]|uniref:Uncharacterized protein n=1 Tax=Entomophthora muscae TaxID=34485 RepID=A0ACC2S7R7_9FUNG|nr:hypothetical protein DSO57_1013383 [Entomophthora muscae]
MYKGTITPSLITPSGNHFPKEHINQQIKEIPTQDPDITQIKHLSSKGTWFFQSSMASRIYMDTVRLTT